MYFFSYPALQMWVSRYLITNTARIISDLGMAIPLEIILPIVAIVCGSIDLARIGKGSYKSKLFKAFDITGIVLGSIIFLIVSMFMLGEIVVPH